MAVCPARLASRRRAGVKIEQLDAAATSVWTHAHFFIFSAPKTPTARVSFLADLRSGMGR